jgi:osmotically-inducible protein OsmY
VTKPSDETVASTFESRLLKLPVYKDHAEVVATLENRTLTLTGTVQTQNERKMVERLALLEPGVSRVNNQLSVVSADQ